MRFVADTGTAIASTGVAHIGGTLLTYEAILRFDFKNKSPNSGYTIRVMFTDGMFLDMSVGSYGAVVGLIGPGRWPGSSLRTSPVN